ncbi:MAG: hypothetical protein WD269_04600 [Acidimicrobiia bacterium]
MPEPEALPSDSAVHCFANGLAHLISELGQEAAMGIAGRVALGLIEEASISEVEPVDYEVAHTAVPLTRTPPTPAMGPVTPREEPCHPPFALV